MVFKQAKAPLTQVQLLFGEHKMTVYKEAILDAITGEETKISFSPTELEQFEEKALQANADREAKEKAQLEKAEARSAAEAKLIALGLTIEDLKALLG